MFSEKRLPDDAFLPAGMVDHVRPVTTASPGLVTMPKEHTVRLAEEERLLALSAFGQLDTPREEIFDALTRLAAHICEAPVSLISLIDESRVWYKSRFGIKEDASPRQASFCPLVLENTGLLEIHNTRTDKRTAHLHVLHGSALIQFYAGVPLVSPDGFVLGSLCVMDTRPRSLSVGQRERLQTLAADVMAHFGLRKKEAELQRANIVAEQCLRLVEKFFSNMNHELRTPMNGVLGMANLLLGTELTDEQRDYAETIQHSGDSLMQVLDDILEYNKLEAGQIDLKPELCSLRNIIEGCFQEFAAPAAQKKLELLYALEENVPEYIECDPRRVKQILVQLVDNAIKNTTAGEILVQVQYLKSSPRHIDLQFVVKDTGKGLTPSQIDTLFHSHFPVHTHDGRKPGGPGLGLALVKRLCRCMSGYAWAESEPGQGAAFYFTLKLGLPENEDLPVQDTSALRGRKILIYTRQSQVMAIRSRECRNWGMEVINASGMMEAFKWLKRMAFDVILVDTDEPVEEGVELAGYVRTLAGEKLPPLVLTTRPGAFTAGNEHVRPLFAAVYDKPLKYADLRHCLMNMVNHEPGNTQTHMTEPEGGQALKILVAEDNPVNQKLMRVILSKLGYACDMAANGREVVEALGRSRYHLIFMDVQMPELSGLEATRQIRAQYGNEYAPVIVALTANNTDADRDECREAGMDDYLSKPYNMDVIDHILKHWSPVLKQRFGV